MRSFHGNLGQLASPIDSLPVIDNRVSTMEDWVRRKNLRIDGLPESPNEISELTTSAVQSLITEKLGVDNLSVSTAYRIKQGTQADRTRHIMAHLPSEATCFCAAGLILVL